MNIVKQEINIQLRKGMGEGIFDEGASEES